MLLVIDAGNTTTVLGFFRGSRLRQRLSIPTIELQADAHAVSAVRRGLASYKLRKEDVSDVVICSVVPKGTRVLVRELRELTHVQPFVITGKTEVPLKVRYRSRATLGADRLCAASSAFARYGGPCIVVDLGSATTFDVVSRSGEYLGGAIAPGLATSASALHSKTAQLPHVKLLFPPSVIGTDTVQSIQSGVLFGAVAMIEGMIKKMKREIGGTGTVVATGGYSKLVGKHTNIFDIVEQNLVLEGARLIWHFQREPRGTIR